MPPLFKLTAWLLLVLWYMRLSTIVANRKDYTMTMNHKDTAPERIWVATPVSFRSLISKSGPAFANDIEYARVDPPAAPIDYVETLEGVIRQLEAMRRGPLWNANGYDGALSTLLNELRTYPNLVREFEKRSAEFVSSLLLSSPAPDEADKAVAKRIVGKDGRAVYDFYALMDRIAAALAQARKQTWEKAIEIAKAAEYDTGQEHVL